jgi:5S rRNA maturation endonuclease (ribonuclease M5)
MSDLGNLLEAVVRKVKGDPNPKHSTKEELRFGTNGSLSVKIAGDDAGIWYDFEKKIGGGTLDFLEVEKNLTNGAALDFMRDMGLDVGQPPAAVHVAREKPKFVTDYHYHDAAGTVVYRVVRWAFADGSKTFSQSGTDGNGGWLKGKGAMNGVTLVPYRLPEVLAAIAAGKTVLIPEGEKDVENLRRLGFAATCNPGGAGKWPAGFSEHFRDADVVILADNDKAGRDHADLVASNLKHVARRVRILDMPPGTPEKGDISWHIEQGAKADRIDAMISEARDVSVPELAAAVQVPSAKPHFLMNSADDVLEAFNPKYAVVNESGKVVVYNPKRDEQLKRDTIERIQFEDFRRMFMNQKVEVGVSKKGNPIYSNIGDVWLEHPKRRQFLGGVVMSPGNKVPDDCWNLWRGFTVDPMPGDWSRMYDHIRDVICGGDQKVFAYTLGWLARMVQQPDKQGEVALVLRGKKGTGKGTLGNWMVRLLGQHSVHVYHAKHLVGTFNAHLRDAVFVFADEAFFAGDKAHEGMLKGLVTEPIITIEAKYQNAVSIANMTHILMASNSDWVVPTSSDERRFCVMDVSDHRIGDKAYFTALNEQMENGGLAAMLHDLLNMDLSKFNVRDVPQTDALADQKRLSLDSLHRWWFTVLQRGFVWRSRYGAAIFMDWSDFVSTELLYRSYLQWCNETREGRPMSREQLGVMMKGLYQSARPRGHHPVYEIESMDSQEGKVAATMERPQGYRVGSLRTAQLEFTKANGIAFDWEDDEPTEDFDF